MCGMKLVMETYQCVDKCKICTEIVTKLERIRKEEDKIRHWRRESRLREVHLQLSGKAQDDRVP